MNLYSKLLEVKKKVPYIKKDKKGFNYTYVTPGKIFSEVNPLLNEAGILLVTKVIDAKSYEIVTGKNRDKHEWKYDLEFIFEWVDITDGEIVSIPWKASGVNGEDKGLGSALTYAERYFILKQFNIPTDDDDPDAFQDKHLTNAEKKLKAETDKKDAELKAQNEVAAEKETAIYEMAQTKDIEELKQVWAKWKKFQTHTEFSAKKDEMKTKHSPAPATP